MSGNVELRACILCVGETTSRIRRPANCPSFLPRVIDIHCGDLQTVHTSKKLRPRQNTKSRNEVGEGRERPYLLKRDIKS